VSRERDNTDMRKWTKRMLGAGVLAAAAYAVWRAVEARKVDTGVSWQHQPFPYPPVPRPEPAIPDTAVTWVEPQGAVCPASHPVKGKLTSGIFHLPGGANYERTKPDRCYVTGDAAEADGLRAAAR
jgi:hypothetical protein